MPDYPEKTAPILCVLGLGSNKSYKGFPSSELITAAAAELQKIFTDIRLSPFYKTAPLYVTDQEPFINAAVSGIFSFTQTKPNNKSLFFASYELLAAIQKIEARYGRNRDNERRWGERTLDIDILLFGDLVLAENNLVIPHPRLKERAFALRPLLDLLPDATEPGTGKRYDKILAELPSQEIDHYKP